MPPRLSNLATDEMEHMKKQFLAWVDSVVHSTQKTTRECISYVKDYFDKQFWADRRKLCQPYFQNKSGGHRKTSIPSEQEFSRLKGSAFGTRANMNISASQDAIQTVEEQALGDVERQDFQALSQTHAGDLGSLEEILTSHLNSRSCFELLQRFEASKQSHSIQVDTTTFLVRRKDPPQVSNLSASSKRRCMDLLPKFWRTRRVTIENGRAACSCMNFEKTGIVCKDVMAIFVTPPAANLCSPSHLKKYQTHYGKNLNFTQIVDAALAKLPSGVPVSSLELKNANSGGMPLQWFEEGLKCCLSPRTPSYLPPADSVDGTFEEGRDGCDIDISFPPADHDEDDPPSDDEDTLVLRYLSKVPVKRKVRTGPLCNEKPVPQLTKLAEMMGNSIKDKKTLDRVYNSMIDIFETIEPATAMLSQRDTAAVASFPETEKRQSVKRGVSAGEKARKAAKKSSTIN